MDGPFRIEKPSNIITKGVNETAGDQFKSYMSRLLTLIPGEALGAYLTIRGFFLSSDGKAPTEGQAGEFVKYLPLVGLACVLISRIWGTRDSSGRSAQIVGTVIASIAFILWVIAMGHQPLGLQLDGRIASTLIVLFSFVVPYFYKGE